MGTAATRRSVSDELATQLNVPRGAVIGQIFTRIRALSGKHDISAHSLVVAQGQKGRWQEKREQYRARVSDAFIEKHAARHAHRLTVALALLPRPSLRSGASFGVRGSG